MGEACCAAQPGFSCRRVSMGCRTAQRHRGQLPVLVGNPPEVGLDFQRHRKASKTLRWVVSSRPSRPRNVAGPASGLANTGMQNRWDGSVIGPCRGAPTGSRVKIFQKEVVRAEGIGLDVLVLTNGAVASASASGVRAAAQLSRSKLKESSTDFFVA